MSGTEQVGVDGRKKRRKEERESVRGQIDSLIARHFPDWVAGRCDLKISAEDVRFLTVKIDEILKTPDQVRVARRIITKLLQKGATDLGWTVDALPAPIIRIPRPTSPFEPTTFWHAHALSGVILQHRRALESPPFSRDSNPMYRAGQLLFSSITAGGLLCSSLIEQLPMQLAEPLHEFGGDLWFDFLLNPDVVGARPAYRRWFPEPVTTCLILRWKLEGWAWPGLTASELLVEYLKMIGIQHKFAVIGTPGKGDTEIRRRGGWFVFKLPVDDVLVPKVVRASEETLLDFILVGAETRIREWVPAALVDFATKLQAGTSLPPSAWWRTRLEQRLLRPLTGGIESSRNDGPPEVVQRASKLERPSGKPMGEGDQWVLYGLLSDCLRTDKERLETGEAIKRLNAFCSRYKGLCSHLLQGLYGWVLWCLESRTLGQGTIKVNSTRRYLHAVGRGLVANGAELDLLALPPEGYIALYEAALAGAKTPNQREYMRDRLEEFHEYLRLTGTAPAIAWQTTGLRRELKFPDANLITEFEYGHVLGLLRRGPTERDQEMHSLIAAFGFRLGMRRDEVAGVQLGALQGVLDPGSGKLSPRPLLWIHATEVSDVKRSSSRRRLPLAILLTVNELKLLRRWIQRRYRECGNRWSPSMLLFTETAGGTEKIGDTSFRAVTLAMQEVSGDPSLHYHHLRHSFITLANTKLLSVKDPLGRLRLPDSWMPTTARLQPGGFVRALFQQDSAPRQALYQVSALAGQLDPRESLQSYNHGFDFLLERHLARIDFPISLKMLATLQGISYASAGVQRHRLLIANLPPAKDQDEKEKEKEDDAAEDSEESKDSAEPSTLREDLLDLLQAQNVLMAKVREANLIAAPPATEPFWTNKAAQQSPKRTLWDLSLDDAYALAISGLSPGMAAMHAERFEITEREVERFIRAARTRMDFKPSPHAGKKQADPRKFPEVVGGGRALPTGRAELRDARKVFDRLKAALTDKGRQDNARRVLGVYAALENRNNAELVSNDDQVIRDLKALLGVAGIEQHRVRLRLLSTPKADTAQASVAAGKRAVSELFGVPQKNVGTPSRYVQTRGGSTYGRVSLEVLAPFSRREERLEAKGSSGSGEDAGLTSKRRLGYGWKIACFYAACVADAMNTHE